MEQLGYYYGFVVYRTTISSRDVITIDVPGIRDRGIVYCDRVRPRPNLTLTTFCVYCILYPTVPHVN